MAGTSQPFATPADLAARWHALTGEESERAGALLADASDLIRTVCADWDTRPEPTLTRVACQMVKRAMVGMELAGVSQTSQTSGPFSESFSYSNPDGDLYLTASERRSLGVGRQEAFAVSLGAVR